MVKSTTKPNKVNDQVDTENKDEEERSGFIMHMVDKDDVYREWEINGGKEGPSQGLTSNQNQDRTKVLT